MISSSAARGQRRELVQSSPCRSVQERIHRRRREMSMKFELKCLQEKILGFSSKIGTLSNASLSESAAAVTRRRTVTSEVDVSDDLLHPSQIHIREQLSSSIFPENLLVLRTTLLMKRQKLQSNLPAILPKLPRNFWPPGGPAPTADFSKLDGRNSAMYQLTGLSFPYPARQISLFLQGGGWSSR